MGKCLTENLPCSQRTLSYQRHIMYDLWGLVSSLDCISMPWILPQSKVWYPPQPISNPNTSRSCRHARPSLSYWGYHTITLSHQPQPHPQCKSSSSASSRLPLWQLQHPHQLPIRKRFQFGLARGASFALVPDHHQGVRLKTLAKTRILIKHGVCMQVASTWSSYLRVDSDWFSIGGIVFNLTTGRRIALRTNSDDSYKKLYFSGSVSFRNLGLDPWNGRMKVVWKEIILLISTIASFWGPA